MLLGSHHDGVSARLGEKAGRKDTMNMCVYTTHARFHNSPGFLASLPF